MAGNVIGRATWEDCHGCRFRDEGDGGCTVDDQEFQDNIGFDGVSFTCGCYQAADPEEVETCSSES